jgi:hypothetical protein
MEFPKLVADLDLALAANLLWMHVPAKLRPRSTGLTYRFRDASQ